jgi:hypothetical protein
VLICTPGVVLPFLRGVERRAPEHHCQPLEPSIQKTQVCPLIESPPFLARLTAFVADSQSCQPSSAANSEVRAAHDSHDVISTISLLSVA